MKEIPISNEIPDIYPRLQNKFGVEWDKGIIIAYKGRIHSKYEIQPEKIVHENVHLERQAELGEDIWWACYLEDDAFRLKEEKIAYKKEADFIKRYIKHREVRFRLINELAHHLSSSQYGNIISKKEALMFLLK